MCDDPNIEDESTSVKLPPKPMIVVHRSDSSGTTSIFTNYLSSVDPECDKSVGKGS